MMNSTPVRCISPTNAAIETIERTNPAMATINRPVTIQNEKSSPSRMSDLDFHSYFKDFEKNEKLGKPKNQMYSRQEFLS